MSEDQLIFWLFMGIFAFLSILKTLRRYQASQKGPNTSKVTPVDTKPQNPLIPAAANCRCSIVRSEPANSGDDKETDQIVETQDYEQRQMEQQQDMLAQNSRGFYTIDDNPSAETQLSNNSTREHTGSRPESSIQQKKEEKSKKIHYIKLIINHSMSFNSAFLIVGGLSESYMYGLSMIPNIMAVMTGYIYGMLIMYPFLYSLDLKSPYDYLKSRYGGRECVKIACLCIAMFYYFSFGSLFLWGCAAIVNILATDIFSLTAANIVLGIYSASGSFLGGYVQSTRTNVSQFLVVLLGIFFAMFLTAINQETYNDGTLKESFRQIWQLAYDHKRTTVFNKKVDLTSRYTILNQLVSLPLPWCSKLTIFLPNYLKYKSIKSKTRSRIFFLSQIPVTIIFNLVLIVAGSLFCFAYFFAECDPLHAGQVKNKNQLGIFWLHSILIDSNFSAVSGIFFASIVYFGLIQHSISMSTIGRTLYDEIIGPYFVNKLNRVQDGFKHKIKMFAPVVIALASIPYANLFQYSKNTMLSLFFVFNNSMNAPILGLFLLSMFNPYANHVGATSAFLLNISINFWMAIGMLGFSETKSQELESRTIICDENGFPSNYSHYHHYVHKSNSLEFNSTISLFEGILNNTQPSSHFLHKFHLHYLSPSNPFLYFMYSVAPIWYCLFSVLFNLVFGSIFSLIYSLVKTGRIDLDSDFKNERKKYLFFYRLKYFY